MISSRDWMLALDMQSLITRIIIVKILWYKNSYY